MSEHVDRQNWRNNWLSWIQEFADDEMQRLAWLNPANRNPHFGFVELNECYFGDLSAVGGYKVAVTTGLLTSAEESAVAAFHALAEGYESPSGDDYNHVAILADPNWADIVRSAKEAQLALSTLLTEPTERASLQQRSSFAVEAIRPT